jgi:hypothetical protein
MSGINYIEVFSTCAVSVVIIPLWSSPASPKTKISFFDTFLLLKRYYK